MNQFGKILKFELRNYFKNKIFVGTTLLLVLVIAAVMCFPRFSVLLERETPDVSASAPVMLVKPHEAMQDGLVEASFAEAFPEGGSLAVAVYVQKARGQIPSRGVDFKFGGNGGQIAYSGYFFVLNRYIGPEGPGTGSVHDGGVPDHIVHHDFSPLS